MLGPGAEVAVRTRTRFHLVSRQRIFEDARLTCMGKSRRGRTAQIIGYLLGAVLLGVLALVNFASEFGLQRSGIDVSAKVISVDRSKYGHLEVQFTTRTERTIRAKISNNQWNGRLPGAGETIKVRYSPADPGGSVLQANRNAFDRYWLVVIFGGGSLVFFYVASRSIRRTRPIAIPAEFAVLPDGDATATWPDGRKGSAGL
ncbi:DUF3592 domain-containing protein [Actinomadura rudentiformis]|uniref:DUF3592 domain-containing protein n=1 Tax=Actinomadura rudentiformis TaxID=359158 RepID=A0A6H9Z501_9ACTN|nr:DUF3592 domain-containing protein [Actinomadura rudentiformis]KAB2351031.1 DUF3592 domain-containing protein [Actinomadura rudentiformis]